MDFLYKDYSDDVNNVGKNIRKARSMAGISQTELANRIGSNKNAVSRYENGIQVPSLTTLMRIAEKIKDQFLVSISGRALPALPFFLNIGRT